LFSVFDSDMCSVAFIAAVLLSDSVFYGRLTFTPLNFLLTNLSSISSVYGTNAWHYYLSQGLPMLCVTSLPFALHGAYKTARAGSDRTTAPLKWLLGLIIWTIGIYSLTGHKEWRFIHPLLPILHIFAAKSLAELFDAHKSSPPTDTPPNPRSKNIFTMFKNMPIRKTHTAILMIPLLAVQYLTTTHSRAQISVMQYLRALPPEELQTLGFLMPCHSTPWQSHLHKPELDDPGRMWALGCEPPVL
jgi:phosphatidylinositol glycan class B